MGEAGKKLAEDWKKIVFQNLKHPNSLGKRFRFSLDFEKNIEYTEAEKEKESSIWIAVNRENAKPTNSLVIRRCNTNFIIAGSPTLSYDDIKEYHAEPAVLDDDFKYINIYYNDRVNVPNAEIYLTMQYNYFTRGIKINDRLLIGDVDLENKKNNNVFKVKAVEKFRSLSTFKVGTDLANSDVALVVIALDKDTLNTDEEDFENRVAKQCPLYKIKDIEIDDEEETKDDTNNNGETEEITDNYHIEFEEEIPKKILQDEQLNITCNLFNNNIKIDEVVFEVESDLIGTEKDSLYYSLEQNSINNFTLLNKRAYLNNKLLLNFTCLLPNGEKSVKAIELILGGFY
jgi:hypothetical protein